MMPNVFRSNPVENLTRKLPCQMSGPRTGLLVLDRSATGYGDFEGRRLRDHRIKRQVPVHIPESLFVRAMDDETPVKTSYQMAKVDE